MSSTGLLPIVYQLDITGINKNNKIIDEPHTLDSKRVRAIAPISSPFFSDSVIIKDSLTNNELPRTSYKFFNIQALASAMYGKEIYTIILITDVNVSNNVKVTYQTLGGEYTRMYDSTIELLNVLHSDNRPAAWPSILNKPETFKPNLHLHAIGDTIGFEYVVSALERLRTTIMVASSLNADGLLEYLEQRLSQLSNINHELISSLDALNTDTASFGIHISETNNPHKTTKSQVGLDNIENYPPTKEKDDLIKPLDKGIKYVTNVVLKDYLLGELDNYNSTLINNINNTKELLISLENTISNLENITGNLFNIQTSINFLNNSYSNLINRIDAVESNIINSPSRANTIINQYLNGGN